MSNNSISALLDELVALLNDRVSIEPENLIKHGDDESFYLPQPPSIVVYPVSTEEVSSVIKLCSKCGIAIIPYGAGTSLEGHILAIKESVCIDLSRMNKLLAIHEEDLDARVEAGVMRSQLNADLNARNLFFPIGPGADASIGGMCATNASGTNAVRYGTMKENVMGLTVVLANGDVIKTGGRTRKSSSGYNLTNLFVGSEGTLGIITEVSVRIYGRLPTTASAVCVFDTLVGAVNATIKTIQSGIPIARIELLDEVQIDAVNRYSKTQYDCKPTLFMEFQGSKLSVKEDAESVSAISSACGGGKYRWASEEHQRKKLWQARHDIAHACKALRPGSEFWSTDVCVPISQLADCILATRKDIDETGLTAPIVGHVGDGNFHVVMVLDPNSKDEVSICKAFSQRLIKRALSMDGTITGEHGIGYGKREYLRDEHGDAVDLMKLIKAAMDPKNILNPGKVLPDD
jgi:D-lactate dehydrogenase (cytochrome)